CGTTLSCAALQSYCLMSNPDRTSASSYSCQPICPAGDCTCFCDKPDGCTFKPAGSDCPADTCTCSTSTVGPGIPLPGAIQVQCNYLVRGSGACYSDPNAAGRCGGLSSAILCEGPAQNLGANCSLLPDSASTASCDTEIHDYCCDSG